MNNFLTVLRKLHKSSPEELRVRASQKLNALAERRGWSPLTRMPNEAVLESWFDAYIPGNHTFSAEALLEHFRTRTSPRFFAAFEEKEQTAAQLRRRFAQSAETVINRAQRTGKGRFDLLGLSDLNFGNPINWHFEPLLGREAPRLHWSRVSYLDAEQVGDKKIIWELNRHQYFLTLGRAYWHTGDELYSEIFINHIKSWIEANPPKVGINWASSLEVAFRAISWLWALYFFKDSEKLTGAVFLRMLKLLYLHGRHLETYLSTYFSPNTHLTGEALGLFYLGILLPELRCAERWRIKGEEILLEQLDIHVRGDGVYFEQSSYYHRYTTDFYAHLLILSRQNGLPTSANLENKLKALLDHLMFITRPDGTSPLFGDDDGGRLVFLDDPEPDDFRSALSNGAALFQRPDYKFVAGEASEETMWLLGQKGLEAFDSIKASPPETQSRAFKEGGYYIMRDGWSHDSNYLLIDCGPHGALMHGHAHADALSFELSAWGRTMLVDPGTYTYTRSAKWRDYFRSSSAHNTLTIDGQSSSVPSGPFSWLNVAQAHALKWIESERFDYFEGSHDGYLRLSNSATHTRSILFLKKDYSIVLDRVSTEGTHNYELHFHFSEGAKPEIEIRDDQAVVCERSADRPGLEVAAFGPGGYWRIDEGSVSRAYASRHVAPILVFALQARGASEFVTFLFPRHASQGKMRVRQLESENGQAFEIVDGVQRDVFIIGQGETVKTVHLSSDFRLAWIRSSLDASAIQELIVIGGRNLWQDDEEIIRSSESIDYATASRHGDELRWQRNKTGDCRSADAKGELTESDLQLANL